MTLRNSLNQIRVHGIEDRGEFMLPNKETLRDAFLGSTQGFFGCYGVL